jgi:hypothetical protein
MLLALSVLAPAVFFGFAAWRDRSQLLSDAESRVGKAAELLDEHATAVFETQSLITGYSDAVGLGEFESAVATLKKPFKLRDLDDAVHKAIGAAERGAEIVALRPRA